MTRLLLVGIAVLLVFLLFGRPHHAAPEPTVVRRAATVVASRPAAVPSPLPDPAEVGGTPTIDLLAHLAGRRRLISAAPYTYFDSLFVETDSVIRRWAEIGSPLLVAVPSDSGRANPQLIALVRRALSIWEDAQVGIRFIVTADTLGAQVVVHSAPRSLGARAGETHLEWTRDGTIRSAAITLARSDSADRAISESAALAFAVHEIGHALGLPHSANPDDVMFFATRTSQLSPRDRATIALLYELPIGSMREIAPR